MSLKTKNVDSKERYLPYLVNHGSQTQFPMLLVNLKKKGANIKYLLEKVMQTPRNRFQSVPLTFFNNEMLVLLEAPHKYTLFQYAKLQDHDYNLGIEVNQYQQSTLLQQCHALHLFGFVNTRGCKSTRFCCFWLHPRQSKLYFTDTSKSMKLRLISTNPNIFVQTIRNIFAEYTREQKYYHDFEEYMDQKFEGIFVARSQHPRAMKKFSSNIRYQLSQPKFMFLDFVIIPKKQTRKYVKRGRKRQSKYWNTKKKISVDASKRTNVDIIPYKPPLSDNRHSFGFSKQFHTNGEDDPGFEGYNYGLHDQKKYEKECSDQEDDGIHGQDKYEHGYNRNGGFGFGYGAYNNYETRGLDDYEPPGDDGYNPHGFDEYDPNGGEYYNSPGDDEYHPNGLNNYHSPGDDEYGLDGYNKDTNDRYDHYDYNDTGGAKHLDNELWL